MTSLPGGETRARNRAGFSGVFGHIYSFMMEPPWLGRLAAAMYWGGDARPFYESMRAISECPDGALVVDAPCGSGVAFAALSSSNRLHYLALDLSPAMLERARRRAHALGLDQLNFIEGDAERIPLPDASVDLFLSYWGLHCMPDPDAAVREIARCLRRGGRVVGSMVCRGRGLRQRLILRPGTRVFGPSGTADDLARWLAESGLTQTRLELSGPFAYFEASA